MSPQSIRHSLARAAAALGAVTLVIVGYSIDTHTHIHPAVFAFSLLGAWFALLAWLITIHEARLKDETTDDVLDLLSDAELRVATAALVGFRRGQSSEGVTRLADYAARRARRRASG